MKLLLLIFVLSCYGSKSYIVYASKVRDKVESICAVCHGIDGQAYTAGNSSVVPNLTAQNKTYLIEKLKAYKNGSIKHHQMNLIAQMLSEKDIVDLSEWYSDIEIEIKTKFEDSN